MLDTQQTDINAAISENEVVIYHIYACLYYKYIYYTWMAINEKQLNDKYNYVTNLLFILQHPHQQWYKHLAGGASRHLNVQVMRAFYQIQAQ